MLEDRDDVLMFGGGKGCWSRVAGYKVVKDWHCDCATGFIEEDDGD